MIQCFTATPRAWHNPRTVEEAPATATPPNIATAHCITDHGNQPHSPTAAIPPRFRRLAIPPDRPANRRRPRAEHGHIRRHPPLPRTRARHRPKPQITADIGDDLGHRTVPDLLIQIWPIQTLDELRVQRIRLRAISLALDPILDRADDLPPRGSAAQPERADRLIQGLRQPDRAPHGPRNPLERHHGLGRRHPTLGPGLLLHQPRQIRPDLDQPVQDLAVIRRIAAGAVAR